MWQLCGQAEAAIFNVAALGGMHSNVGSCSNLGINLICNSHPAKGGSRFLASVLMSLGADRWGTLGR
uniref:Uncharacterized protein n=1 Tax=Anguilla anguilla TaxID=7936 RepID=A0A0E9RBL7_ANGAN